MSAGAVWPSQTPQNKRAVLDLVKSNHLVDRMFSIIVHDLYCVFNKKDGNYMYAVHAKPVIFG